MSQTANVPRNPPCGNCGSRERHNIDGQITCARCGLILVARQVVLEEQDVPQGVLVNLKRARRGQQSKESKAQKEEQTAEKDAEETYQLTLEESVAMFDDCCKQLAERGFPVEDVAKAKTSFLERVPTGPMRPVRLLPIVYGCLLAHSNDPALTAWDIAHLCKIEAIPCLKYGGPENGPSYKVLRDVTEAVNPERAYNLHALVFRCSFRLARYMKIQPCSLWFASWIVCFGLGGLKDVRPGDIIMVAAGVIASVVLIKDWTDKVISTQDSLEFSFFPVWNYALYENLLEALEMQSVVRQTHNRKLEANMQAYTGELKREPDLDAETLFRRKIGRDDDSQLGGSKRCNGDCLDKFLPKGVISQNTLSSFRELDVWQENVDGRYPDDPTRALDRLRHLAASGLDNEIARENRSNPPYQTMHTIIRRIAKTASSLSINTPIEEFHQDTTRLLVHSCRDLLCCERVERR